MIHKIKAMYDARRGISIRAIAVERKISRNTVRKYLAMSAEEISAIRQEAAVAFDHAAIFRVSVFPCF